MPPDQQPNLLRLADRFGSWTNFRIRPEPGKAYPDTQFPVESVAEMSKQSVPDLLGMNRDTNPTWKAMSDLALQLDGAVLRYHSRSGPLSVAGGPHQCKGYSRYRDGGTRHLQRQGAYRR